MRLDIFTSGQLAKLEVWRRIGVSVLLIRGQRGMLPVIEVTEHKLDYLRGHHDLRGCLEAAMAGTTKMAVT